MLQILGVAKLQIPMWKGVVTSVSDLMKWDAWTMNLANHKVHIRHPNTPNMQVNLQTV